MTKWMGWLSAAALPPWIHRNGGELHDETLATASCSNVENKGLSSGARRRARGLRLPQLHSY